MDALFFLFGLASLGWALAPIILFVLHFKMKARVRDLAGQVTQLEARVASAPPDAPAPPGATPVQSTVPTVAKPPEARATRPAPPQTIFKRPEDAPAPLPPQPDISEPDTPPKAFVFRQDRIAEAFQWLKANWVLAAGAASLSLAGIFLVQYGMERGLLTPFWRVMAAIAFGAALMAGGEYMRRRFGDDTDGAAQFLPSALSGAGLLTLFAAVLSARVLYDLIGVGQAFAGLVAVSAIGVVFGWFYGPVLTVVGILGATSAPYLIGGSSEQAWLLQYYFALIGLTALAIDTLKRWAWVSALALLATGASIWLTYLGTQSSQHFLAAALVLAAGAIMIPQRRLVPNHTGAPVLALFWKQRPEFPTRLSFGATLNAGVAALAVSIIGGNLADAYLGLAVMVALMVATTLWMWRAPALADHAMIPALAYLGLIATQAVLGGPMYDTFVEAMNRPPESAPPATVWLLLGVAAIGSVLMFWRMRRAQMPLIWALAATSLAPIAVFVLEFLWDPTRVYGAYPWALAVIAVAAVMTVLAERAMRLELVDKRLITAMFAVAALSLIGLALFLMLTKAALTLALAAMIVFVTMLDRRFDLPLLVYYSAIGAAVITYRLVVDPGIGWAMDQTSLPQIIIAYAGTMATLAVAWAVAHTQRPRLAVTLESTLWVLAATFIAILFERLLPGEGLQSHWGVGLLAAIWATMALAQVYRMAGATKFEGRVRRVLALLLGLMTLGTLLVQAFAHNPLDGSIIMGPPFFSSLALAYLPLAAVLGLAAWKLPSLNREARVALALASTGFGAGYIGLSIRHFWRGPDLSVGGFSDAELYTYTLAMLLVSAGLLVVAFWKRAVWLRQLALAGIGLTIAKVFLVDMSGLAGLFRVVSFMGLGLALLALTWADRVMSAQWERAEEA
ncbi:MAG: DUF2339 domain-containing protein [Pseudomonadota bacterium]